MSISTRKLVYSDKTPLLVSGVSFCVSVIALVISVKSINKTNEIDIISGIENENKRKIEKNIPDVEIIRPDGSVVQVKSLDSKDNISQIVDNKDEKKDKNVIIQKKAPVPVVRNAIQNNKNSSKNDNQQKKIENTTKINGKYVLQVGSFQTKELALKHCEKIKKYIGSKQCDVSLTNSRSIVYPFASAEEAKKMSAILLQKAGINSLVKQHK